MRWVELKQRFQSFMALVQGKERPSIPSLPTESSDIEVVKDVMGAAIKVMSEFPEDFIPPNVTPPETRSLDADRWMRGISVKEILSEPQIHPWLEGIKDTWPAELLPVFWESGRILSHILHGFGVRREDDSPTGMLAAAMADPETLRLMSALGEVRRDATALRKDREDAEDVDPFDFSRVAMEEILRRSIARRSPFARTLTTLLGQDALLWLTADSQDGLGKIQPHEFSRTGWRNLWAIESQMVIERELLDWPPEDRYLAKIVVVLSWTLAGLASFIQPAIFFGERASHLISKRDGMYTVASGTSSHTLVAFQSAAMLSLVRILAEGLTNPLLSAADLMWIGAGLARVREVRSGLGDAVPVAEERFDMFLSHRGRDAKRLLSNAVQELRPAHGVFLDCLTLPRGVINRSFVFGSLARSERILIVETESFHTSEWCRKEAWFADAMAAHGLARVERMTLPAAVARVAADGPPSTRRRSDQKLQYPIARRVLRDLDYWARTPNLHSLQEKGHPTDNLEPLQAVFSTGRYPDDPVWVRSLGEAVAESLAKVAATAPEAEPLDLWSTALQLSIAAFASTSNARSKNEVRRGIDQLNVVLKSVVASKLHHDPVFRARASGHLALLAAAATVDLAGFELDPRMTPAVDVAMDGVAELRDGLLLLDVRERGTKRSFRLQLVALLVQGNLGSVGIVQDAADEVHQSRVNGLSLEVLPCVTLYPGMAAPLGSAPSR